MAALESLRSEHQLIRRTLDALEVYATELEEGRTKDVSDLRDFARFFTDFAELWHHGKEEDVLLPALVRAGLAWEEGLVSLVRQEHEQENYFSRVLEQAASQEGGLTEEDVRHAVASVRKFSEFERNHMQKEELQLYPDAERVLSPEVLADIGERFASFERHRYGGLGYEECRRIAERLVQQYGEGSRGANTVRA